MSAKSPYDAEWDDESLSALGAEMSALMCEEGDHYVVDGVCTACLQPVAEGNEDTS